ncbi:hypothetical protein SADUNF_Sadunf07G0099000 [Salix dunnii]|uniref:Guanosine nucleotide diphosphate dissociation inhibitor n=1 Tax=Salix dunnii TaxID=1413687 RepID=A0A835N2F9_9ROSI|nr:hypothetical protein SADUNF_Sadunf07G0099000 [Salix dunnii]
MKRKRDVLALSGKTILANFLFAPTLITMSKWMYYVIPYCLGMRQVIERRDIHPKNINMLSQPPLEKKLDGGEYAMLIKEIAQKNRELRHMRGEDLQGLDLEELHKLEKLIEGSLRRLVEEKDDKIINEISALKTKGEQLEKDNQRLKQQEMSLLAGQGHLLEPGQSSDSLVTNISSMGSVDLHQDHDNSCAFLTLGLNFVTMDEEYDVIVLGTGLKECILSGLLSVDGLKVLHMDRNDYYGGESTSLNLNQLWKRFRGSDTPPESLGASKEYNVDMIPKFIIANGGLVRVLIHTDVTKYLHFKAVDGSFVYNKGKIYKVPATDVEALKSPLMGLFEKRRARKFFIYVQDYEDNDPKSHEGLDLTKVTAREVISKYGLEDDTVDFIGHALALHLDDSYLDQPALDFVKRMKLYAESLARFQGGSPYIYPLYGLAELPQSFARLSAVYGGTYMLNKPECEVEFDESGKAIGVTSEGETAKCKKVVSDPSYLPNKVKNVGKVARAICIMSHPIPDTSDSHSAQVILPQKQLGRKSDMYLFCCSYAHNVAPKGKYIAFVSAEAETDNPEVELKPGVDLLGPVDEIFYETYDRYVPTNTMEDDNCFISTSYDATTHFETTVQDCVRVRRRRRKGGEGVCEVRRQISVGGCTGAVKIESSNDPIDIDDRLIDVDSGGETNSLCKGNNNEVVDIDPTDVDGQCQYSVSAPAHMPQDDCSVKEISRLDRLFSFSNYENESVGRISDNDARVEISSSTSVSTLVENAGNQVLECGSVGHKIDYTNNTVAVFPDYILCGDVYGAEYCLTFSGSSIRMEGSTANGVKGIFNAEWTIGDIISIESEWCGMVTTAMVYICFKSKVSQGAGNTNDTSGVDKLKFSVCDPQWNEGEEAIKSLHIRYRDNWNVTSDSDWKKDEDAFFGHNGTVISKPYIPVLHEMFEEVIYPKGDPDAVSISKRDVELLRPETFINDTIIDFYIQYLKNKLQPGDKHRFHFFNSFFFRKLADLDKGPSNACGGRLAFQRVHKWTRKINLFEKDYIFIPLNYSYLYEEWRERHDGRVDDTLSKFLHLRFVPLELPQQENSYDCGLFVLHYAERFLEEAPANFSPFKITEFSNFLNRNWFLPVEASLKRASIQKLICEILEDRSSTQFSDPNEEETGVEFLEEISGNGNGTDTGINISVTQKSQLRVAHQQKPGELGLNSRNMIGPGTSARSFSVEDCWQKGTIHGNSCMSPVEETGERISDSLSDTEGYLQPTGLATEFPSTSFSHKSLTSLGSSSSNQKSMQIEEPYDDSSSEASISGSLKSSEIGAGVDEDHFLSQLEGFDHQKQTNCHELSSKSTESEEFVDCVVEDSEEGNSLHNDQVANDSPSSSHCNDLAASTDAIKTTENILQKVRKPVCNVDLASDEQPVGRTKLTSSDGT